MPYFAMNSKAPGIADRRAEKSFGLSRMM